MPSGETDTTAGASVYSSEALHSPSKVSVPSRKQRNQPSSRVNDIAFATEISTSLLGQVKELQAALLSKDELLKAATLERSQLEIEVEGLSQRLRTVDESETRLKDVNWSLETQVRELEASAKAATDKEHRLNHTLSLVKAEKASLEREAEELKQGYAKLSEEHSVATKHHETEISALKRQVSMADTERGALQRKIEDLSTQNQELAKTVAYRMRSVDHATVDDTSPEDGGETADTMTPEHSPPPSPSKATPRHGQLESETLKHSLQHAHRMIQQLKNNIHREKTEKIELRRMLQDARDELETSRNTVNGIGSAGKKKRDEKNVFKKPLRPDRLGAIRVQHQEVVEDDEWEEEHYEERTPSKRSTRQAERVPGAWGGFSSAAEGFETATETSDAFETANERDGTTTETDAFHTGAETLDGDSSDDLTETEGGPSDALRNRRPSPLAIVGNRNSYESTASTSGDEDFDSMDVRTPVQPRYRLKLRQGGYRGRTPRSGQEAASADTPSTAKDSPASFSVPSNDTTPLQGRSLFAELGNLSGDSEDGSVADGTPRSTLLSPESSPEAIRRPILNRSPLQSVVLPRPVMVDSGVMTDSWEPEQPAVSHAGTLTEPELPRKLELSSISHQGTSPVVPRIIHPALALSSVSTQHVEPMAVKRASLALSSILAQDVQPVTAKARPLKVSSVSTQDISPVIVEPPSMKLSSISTQDIRPVAVKPAALALSSVSTQGTEPKAPVVVKTVPPSLGFSSVFTRGTEPQAPLKQEPSHTALTLSPVQVQATTPKEAPVPKTLPLPVVLPSIDAQADKVPQAPAPVPLRVSSLATQTTAPREPAKAALSQVPRVAVQHTEPIEPLRPGLSVVPNVAAQSTKPIEPLRPNLSIASNVAEQHIQPIEPPKQSLSRVSGTSVHTAPIKPLLPALSVVSNVAAQHVAPVSRKPAPSHFSNIAAQHTEPVVVNKANWNSFSDVVVVQETAPESPTLPTFLPNGSRPSTATRSPEISLTFSAILSQAVSPKEPEIPSRPTTAHRIAPAMVDTSESSVQTEPTSRPKEAQKLGFFNSVLPWSTANSKTTEQEARATNGDIAHRPSTASKTLPPTTTSEGTQTMVSAEQIDKLLLLKSQQRHHTLVTAGVDKQMSPPSSPRRSAVDPNRFPRRPGSSSSMRSRAASPPPLPPDHKEVIAAAALKSPAVAAPPSTAGSMGPPSVPASAYKKRPETPVINTPVSSPTKTGTTPRPRHPAPRSDAARSGASSPITRRSSVSSFVSEIDTRFNMSRGPFGQSGLDPNTTDPRMIQAITQTMMGEFLWKYTRKAGREGISENRHRRFFWVHPYTRTLYWSEKDPVTAGKSELKAKSVAIESVHVVTDDNPNPPGLHRKSLVIMTPGRTIKLTAPTGQRHETWFNALSYLLLRTSDETDEQKSTTEDVQEFNPSYRSSSRQTGRSRASLSSHVSRRTSSPHHAQIPTLRHPVATPKRASQEPQQHGSLSGRLSSLSVLRPSSALRGSFSSRRSRTSGQEASVYAASDIRESAEDLRQVIEQQERDADRMELENVRACCDGMFEPPLMLYFFFLTFDIRQT